MVGTYLTWMGAWVQANQAAKTGSASPVALMVGALALSAVSLVIAVLIGIPHAGWNLGSFAVAVLPGLALLTIVTSLGGRRR
jgi:hypothetical protein